MPWHTKSGEKYQVKAELVAFLNDALNCEQYVSQNLDLPGFVKCKAFGQVIEIIFNPTEEVTEEYIFDQIEITLQEIGLEFFKAVLRQYVGNAARTLVASAAGGALGSRAGAVGALVGLLAGAAVEKALFDWKNVCECYHDELGRLVINRLGENE